MESWGRAGDKIIGMFPVSWRKLSINEQLHRGEPRTGASPAVLLQASHCRGETNTRETNVGWETACDTESSKGLTRTSAPLQ